MVLVGKPEETKPFGRPRRRRDEGIRIDRVEIAWRVLSGLNCMRIRTGGGLL
jgi:hypothetical protein